MISAAAWGLKDNQRGGSIHVAQFTARHDGARRLLCDLPVTEVESR